MMKPYENYREANICWVKEIPRHWVSDRIIHLFIENKEANFDLSETNALQFKFGELIPKKKFKLDDELKKTLSKYTKVKPKDIIINGLNLNYDFLTNRIGLVKQKGIITSAYIAIRPRQQINVEYFALLLKNLDARKIFNGMGSGIRLTLDFSELKKMELPIPPKAEQDQIVHFLDWKLSKINKLIKAKKKQIDLLNEQKQAIINKAVTRGLDNNVSLKDSGVFWLGLIPENWTVNRLKRFCKVNASIAHLTSNYCDDDLLVFLAMESVSAQGEIDCSVMRKYKDIKNGYSSFEKNDVVVAKITPCFENGKGACLDLLPTQIGFGTTEFITLRVNESMLPKYLYYITQISWFRLMGADVMTGSAGQKRVPSNFIANFCIGVPNISEQQGIIEYIEESKAEIANMVSKIQRQIDLLSEYKTSLISTVVTGQVDVRNIVVPDFDHDEEPTEEIFVEDLEETEETEVE